MKWYFSGRYLTCYKSIPGFPSGRGVVYVSSKINSFITPIGRNGKLRDPSGRTISKVVGCVKGYYDPIALKRKIQARFARFVDSIRQHVISISIILISRLKCSAKAIFATTCYKVTGGLAILWREPEMIHHANIK